WWIGHQRSGELPLFPEQNRTSWRALPDKGASRRQRIPQWNRASKAAESLAHCRGDSFHSPRLRFAFSIRTAQVGFLAWILAHCLVTLCHVRPPSAVVKLFVFRTFQMVACSASVAWTPARSSFKGDVTTFQCAPPSVVSKIAPRRPTIQQT